jgi:CrcB protein
MAIAAGGAIGALARAGLAEALPRGDWPVATLAVNIVGTILLAAVAALIAWRPRLPHWLNPLAGIGFCGSLTTFAGVQVEALLLMRDGLSGAAALYVLASLALGMAAVVATRRLMGAVMA